MKSSPSSSSSSSSVRLLEQSRVSPPPGSVAEISIPLTFFDITWIHTHPLEHIYFYHLPKPATYLFHSVVPELKSSLSLTLQHFYPLAGNLRLAPGTDDRYEIHCKDGDSVSFTVAESDADFCDLSGGHAREFDRVFALVPGFPHPDDARPLLAVQVTLFPNSGITIGTALHHAACDASGSLHFFKSWASSCSSGGSVPLLQPPPFFDRSAIPDPRGLCSLFLDNLRRIPATQAPGSSDLATKTDAICASFSLRKQDLQALKQFVMAVAKKDAAFHCSRFVVACAHIWVCLVKARRYPRGERAHLLSAIDIRKAVLPDSIRASYFGNCVRPFFVEAEVDELVKVDGLRVAAEAIGRSVGKIIASDVMEDAEEWQEKSIAAAATGRLLPVGGSPRFRPHDVDFGWGKPCKSEMTSIRKSGAVVLAESRDEPEGVDIGLVLPEYVMLEFKSCFSAGIELVRRMIPSSL